MAPRRRQRPHDMSTTTYTTQPQGWRTPVGPGKDTHGTLEPLQREAVSGPTTNATKGKSRCNDASPKHSKTPVLRQTESVPSHFSRCPLAGPSQFPRRWLLRFPWEKKSTVHILKMFGTRIGKKRSRPVAHRAAHLIPFLGIITSKKGTIHQEYHTFEGGSPVFSRQKCTFLSGSIFVVSALLFKTFFIFI